MSDDPTHYGGAKCSSSLSEIYNAMVADVDVDPNLFLQAIGDLAHEENKIAANGSQKPEEHDLASVENHAKPRKRAKRADIGGITRMTTRKRARDEAVAEDTVPVYAALCDPQVGESNTICCPAPSDMGLHDPPLVSSSGYESKSVGVEKEKPEETLDEKKSPETKTASKTRLRGEAEFLWPDGSVDDRVDALKEAMRRVVSFMVPPAAAAGAMGGAARTQAVAVRDSPLKQRRGSVKIVSAAEPAAGSSSDVSANSNSVDTDAKNGRTTGEAMDPVLEQLAELARCMQRYLFAGGSESDILHLEALLHAAVEWKGVTSAALGSPQAGTVAKDLRAASKGRGGRTRITEAAGGVVAAWKDALAATDALTSGGSLLAAAAKFSGSSVVMLKT